MNPLRNFFPETDGLQAALMRQSRAIAAPKKPAPEPDPSAYKVACDAFKRGNAAGPSGLVVPLSSLDDGGYCEFFTQRAAQEDARQSAAPADLTGHVRQFVKDRIAEASSPVHGAALIGFDPAKPGSDCSTVTTWRRGCDIPEAERVGLWHMRTDKSDKWPGLACEAARMKWRSEYRPAAPGAKPDDEYDEARYEQPSAAPVKPPLLWRPWSREAMDALGGALVHLRDTPHHVPTPAQSAEFRPDGVSWKEYLVAAAQTRLHSWFNSAIYQAHDADGWFPHNPVSGAVCPVPDGVEADVRTRGNGPMSLRHLQDQRVNANVWGPCGAVTQIEITGWRPAQ